MNKRKPAKKTAEKERDLRLLTDDLIDGYVGWREQTAAVASAYARWKETPADGQGAAFDEYLAALNREEEAAARYKHLLDVAAAHLGT